MRRVAGAGFYLALLSLLAGHQPAWAEILPSDRRVVWEGNVGVNGGVPSLSTIHTTLAPSGGNDLPQIQTALQTCPASQVVKLSAGTFVMNGALDYSGIGSGKVLRGAGSTNTVLRWDSAGGAAACILMRSFYSSSAIGTGVDLASNAVKDSRQLQLSSVPPWIKTGHLYLVDQLDDPAFVRRGSTQIFENGVDFRFQFVTTSWGNRGLGQLVKVASINGNTVTTEIPLYYGFSTGFAARFWGSGYDASATAPLRRCGIEQLKIVGNFTNANTHTIKMENTEECWLSDIESVLCPGLDHVFLIFAYRCEVRDSQFYDSALWGPGQGYGVALYNNCSANLVENNVFRGLHVSMQANFGSSGNVFGYNYAFGGKADSGNDPSISFHGTHAYMNLCEGNYGAMRVEGDIVHGSSSHNVLFRNRLTGYEPGKPYDQTPVEVDYYNRRYSVVGNVLGVLGIHTVYQRANGEGCSPWGDQAVYKIGYTNPWGCDSKFFDTLATSDVLRHLNWDPTTSTHAGVVRDPAIPELTLPDSYYLPCKPDWFADLTWPPFSPFSPSDAVVTNLPAGFRHTFGKAPARTGAPSAPRNLRVKLD